MDYERKYNNIVNRMRAIMESETRSDKFEEVIKWNFPEITEPKDEKIRKKIIEGFQFYGDSFKTFGGLEVKDIIAWLEKQRKQKSIDELTPQEAMDVAVSKCFEQDEQKPAESESFEIEHGKYYFCIKDYYSGGNKRCSKGDVVQALRGMSMMALNERAGEYFLPVNSVKQKPVKWADEDERIKEFLNDNLDRYDPSIGWTKEEFIGEFINFINKEQ